MSQITSSLLMADRRALDEVVFEVLGLTAGEREAVYEAVVSPVRLPARCAQACVRFHEGKG